MALGRGHDKGLVIQRPGHRTGFFERVGHDDGVHFTALEHFSQPCGVVLFQNQRHVRCQNAQRRNQSWQQVGADGEDHPQLERPHQLVLVFAGQPFDGFGFLQHALRLLDDAFTNFRHRHFLATTLEQGDAQFVFQLLDGDGQSGLADKAALCGATKWRSRATATM
jgi:hypothetical protein